MPYLFLILQTSGSSFLNCLTWVMVWLHLFHSDFWLGTRGPKQGVRISLSCMKGKDGGWRHWFCYFRFLFLWVFFFFPALIRTFEGNCKIKEIVAGVFVKNVPSVSSLSMMFFCSFAIDILIKFIPSSGTFQIYLSWVLGF